MPLRRSRLVLFGLPILLLLAGLAGPHASGSAVAGADKIAPEVLAQLKEGQGAYLVYLAEQADLRPAYHIRDWHARGRFVYDALRGVAERTQPAVLHSLDRLQSAGSVTRYHPYYIANLILVQGDAAAARSLASRPEVAAIYPEIRIELVRPVQEGTVTSSPKAIEWNILKINADDVWTTYGVTGTGVVVANVDTGVDYTHPALVRQYRGNLGGGTFEHDYNWWDPTDTSDFPADLYPDFPLHGTHVMGTMVGEDITRTNRIGVAPGAKWIAAYGCCPSNEALLSALEWVIAPWQVDDLDPSHPSADPDKRPHVVNNSWGGPGGSLIFNHLLEAQRAAGIFVAFSAGNSGPGCGTLGSPGDNPAAFETGATSSSDSIASFSSRGPDPFHSWLGLHPSGPELSAPGAGIRSSVPRSFLPSGYMNLSGTSQASPHTAGAVALLWSAEPDLIGQITETEDILRRTALPRTTAQTCGGVPGSSIPNSSYGWGRLDVKAAVDMVWQAGILSGTVTDADTGTAVAPATILMQRGSYTLDTTTGPAGTYRFLLGAGTYTVTALAYGYQPRTRGGIAIAQDGVTTLPITLTARPTHTLSGTVREAAARGPGGPVGGQIGLHSTGVELDNDPVSGHYATPVAEGSYRMRVVARGYLPLERLITVTADLTENVDLQPRWTYYSRDSRSPCGPAFGWVDATDGIPHSLADDAVFTISLALHPFTFFGNSYGVAWVSSNGMVSFGQGYTRIHMVFPFEGPPNNAIYGFADDLNPDDGVQGVVYHKFLDGRYLVIEFHQVQHWASGDPETFEFILDLESGAILLQYQEVSWPDFASVGIENQDGSDGILYSYANSAGISNSLAVGFYPIFGAPPADQRPPGVLGTLSGTVYFSGTATPAPWAVVTATSFLRALTTTAGVAAIYQFPSICADLYTLQASAVNCRPGPSRPALLRWADDSAEAELYVLGTCVGAHRAAFSWSPLFPLTNQAAVFTATARGSDPPGFQWAFGDGTYDSGPVVTHSYGRAMTYTAILTATNCSGMVSSSTRQTVTVLAYQIYLPLIRQHG